MIEKSPRVFGDFLGVCTPFAQTICIEKSVKMKPFMDKDFLLDTPTARHLYHDYCEALPICDYHCHLSPKEIYENAQPTDISALWLSGDHYKWRAMRSCGVDERYCTGDASPREKFQKFAYTLQYAIGNPLYHWAHMELQMYFGIDTPLSAATADDIYDRANGAIAAGDFRPRTLIEKSKVKVLCTTDDPADDLVYHKKIKKWCHGYVNALIVMQACNILARIAAYFIGFEGKNLWFAMAVIGLGGIPLGAASIAQTAIFCDSIDYMEWKTGKRTEGITFSMQTSFTKISSGITAGLATLALHLLHYKPIEGASTYLGTQSAAFDRWIWPLVILTPAIASLLYIVPLLFIRYTPAQRAQVEQELKARRAATDSQNT